MKKLIIASAMVLMAGPALAGEPGSAEPDYHGPDQDYPIYGDKDEPGVGPGVPTVDHNIQIGSSAVDNHIEEATDLVHASDTNI